MTNNNSLAGNSEQETVSNNKLIIDHRSLTINH